MSESAVRKYESVIVLDGVLGEAQVEEELTTLKELISRFGGEQPHTHYWGRKELSYEVGKKKVGHYFAFEYDSSEFEVANKLAEQLRIRENVMLFQTHRRGLRSKTFKVRQSDKNAVG